MTLTVELLITQTMARVKLYLQVILLATVVNCTFNYTEVILWLLW